MTAPCSAVIDDDPQILFMLEPLLTAEGFHVLYSTVGDGVYEWIGGEQPDLIILDLWLETPEMGDTVKPRPQLMRHSLGRGQQPTPTR